MKAGNPRGHILIIDDEPSDSDFLLSLSNQGRF